MARRSTPKAAATAPAIPPPDPDPRPPLDSAEFDAWQERQELARVERALTPHLPLLEAFALTKITADRLAAVKAECIRDGLSYAARLRDFYASSSDSIAARLERAGGRPVFLNSEDVIEAGRAVIVRCEVYGRVKPDASPVRPR